jgi:hypothetical protein
MAAVPWFNTAFAGNYANCGNNFDDVINRLIDFTYYGDNKTGVNTPALDAQILAVMNNNPPPGIGVVGAVPGAALAGSRNDADVEGGANIGLSQANPVPVGGVLGQTAMGGSWQFADGVRSGIVNYLHNNYNNGNFQLKNFPGAAGITEDYYAEIYGSAINMGRARALLPVRNAGNANMHDALIIVYKETLLKVFMKLIVPVPPVLAGLPINHVEYLLNTLGETANKGNPFSLSVRNKYLKYKQKYLTLKNEK